MLMTISIFVFLCFSLIYFKTTRPVWAMLPIGWVATWNDGAFRGLKWQHPAAMGNNRNVGRLIRRVTTSSTTRPSKKYPATKDRPSQPLPTPTIKLILFIFYLCVCMCVSFSPSVFACPSPHIFQEPSLSNLFFSNQLVLIKKLWQRKRKKMGKLRYPLSILRFGLERIGFLLLLLIPPSGILSYYYMEHCLLYITIHNICVRLRLFWCFFLS